MTQINPIVSFDSDELILVNDEDRAIGFQTKDVCHDGDGLLHRAFSVFLFNDKGQLLLQQRNASKRLWPMIWSNSCCSHPRRDESIEAAAHRRVQEELAINAPLRFLYKFYYQARYGEVGSEHELCSVFIGSVDRQRVCANENEINAWRFIDVTELEAEMLSHPEQFTPWMKLEWERLSDEFWPIVKTYMSKQNNNSKEERNNIVQEV